MVTSYYYGETLQPFYGLSQFKEDVLALFRQDFLATFGAIESQESDTIRAHDYVESLFILRWMMMIGEDKPLTVREEFGRLSEGCRGQMLRFLSVMEDDFAYEWRLRIYQLQIT
jgi:hypothetical protein